MKNIKKKCYNCQFASDLFKVDDLSHLNCKHPKYKEEDFISGKLSGWDTLQEFWNTCKDFEYVKGSNKTDNNINPLATHEPSN